MDTLFVFLLFVSTALLLESESLWSAALAGVFGALATLTKQPGTNPGQVARDVSRAIRSRWFGALILPPNDRFVNMTELRQF